MISTSIVSPHETMNNRRAGLNIIMRCIPYSQASRTSGEDSQCADTKERMHSCRYRYTIGTNRFTERRMRRRSSPPPSATSAMSITANRKSTKLKAHEKTRAWIIFDLGSDRQDSWSSGDRAALRTNQPFLGATVLAVTWSSFDDHPSMEESEESSCVCLLLQIFTTRFTKQAENNGGGFCVTSASRPP
jgi:hypothetical protein